MSKTVYNSTIFQRTKDFLVANCWMFWILLLVQVSWSMNVDINQNSKIDEAIERLDKTNDSMSKGIVMMDMMGRAITVVPTKITPASPAFKQGISNYIKMYGFYDWAKLTDNFSFKVRTLTTLYDKNPEAVLFKENFFDEGGKAQRDLDAYMTAMVFGMNKNTLPEHISIVDEDIEKFVVDGDTFNIKISYTVLASIFDGNTDTYRKREGNIVVSAIGRLDPSIGTPLNPLGIRFTEAFKPTVLSK